MTSLPSSSLGGMAGPPPPPPPQPPGPTSNGNGLAGGAPPSSSSSSSASSSSGAPSGRSGRPLTRTELIQIAKTLETMKNSGLDGSDPRYQALLHVLRSHSDELQGLLKQQRQQQQQQAPGDKVAVSEPPKESLAVQTAQTGGAPHAASSDKAIANGSHAPSLPSPSRPFTQEQLAQLRAQILAYKYLSRNMALPNALLAAIKTPNQSLRPSSTNEPTDDRLRRLQSFGPGRPIPPKTKPAIFKSLSYNGASNVPPLGQAMTRNTGNRIPMEMVEEEQFPPRAPPLPIQFLMQEREKRITTKILRRLEELRALPADLTPDLRLKAIIEEKQLKLLAVQKKLRHRIAYEMRQEAAIQAAEETAAYRRASRRQHAKHAYDKTDKQREKEEQRRHQRQRDFAQAVVAHAKVFREFHSANGQRWKKVMRGLTTYHSNLVKRRQQQEERSERERLKMLRENDEEGYMRLLEETKNKRLKTLLEQTDAYLNSIGALVARHQEEEEEEDKREAEEKAKLEAESKGEEDKGKEVDANAEGGEAKEGEGKEPEGGAAKGKTVKTYYTMVHKVEEEVKKQPEMLVGGQLKPYQMVGLQWMVSLYNNRLNGILADEMGLGKTIQTIALLCYLKENKGNNGPFLVVVPLSTLSNWVLEFEKWAPGLKKVVYKGNPAARKSLYQNQIAHGKFNALLTTYEYVMKDKSSLGKLRWNYIIVDEGHRIKNHASKLTQIFGQYYKARHRVLLTGTPLQNSLPELWSLLNFLLPTIFNSVENFEEWFNAPFAAAGERLEMTEEESLLIINRLHKVLRPFLLRRLKTSVEDQLPDKVEMILRCGFSAWQKAMYSQMRDQRIIRTGESDQGKGGYKGLMNTLMQLRKICNHPYLFNDQGDWPIDQNLVRAAGKVDLLDRILPKLKVTGHRILMFSQMTSMITIMEDYFHMRGYNYLRLDGTTKAEDRAELLRQFNAKDSPYFIFILSTRAGGLGLNLQTADTVILFDSDWNPHIDLQAQDRAHRIGQTSEVRVYRLITVNSVEEHILARAHYKLGLDHKIIEAGMFNKKSNAKERKQLLEDILRRDNQALPTNDELPTDKQINEMIARTQDEVELFHQMDRERQEKEKEDARRRGLKQPLPRLMQADELPEWMLSEESVLEETDLSLYGRGLRQRPTVNYDDGLSDNQWAKGIEEGNLDEEVAKHAERRAKRKAREAERAEDEEIEDEDEEQEGGKKKRQPAKKRAKAQREPTEDKRARTLKQRKRSPAEEQAQRQRAQMEAILTIVIECKEEGTGRQRSKLFMRLPSKKLYPDYYQVIKNPIGLTRIRQFIEKGKYTTPDIFRDDFMLLFDNAQQYNLPESEIVADALFLKTLFEQEYHERLEKPQPEPQASEQLAGEDDSNATAGTSEQEPTAPADTNEAEKRRARKEKRRLRRERKGEEGSSSSSSHKKRHRSREEKAEGKSRRRHRRVPEEDEEDDNNEGGSSAIPTQPGEEEEVIVEEEVVVEEDDQAGRDQDGEFVPQDNSDE